MSGHRPTVEVSRAGTPTLVRVPAMLNHPAVLEIYRAGTPTLMRVPAQLVEPRKPFGNDRPNFGREVKTDLLIVINPIDTLVFSHNNSGRTTYVRRPYSETLIKFWLDHFFVMFWFPSLSSISADHLTKALIGTRWLELVAVWDRSSIAQTRMNPNLSISDIGIDIVLAKIKGGQRWGRLNSVMVAASADSADCAVSPFLEPPTVSMLSHISAPAKLSSGVHGPAGGNHLTGMRTISSSSDGSMTFTTVDTARRGMVVADRTGASSPSLIMRTTSHRAHGRPESAPAAAPARTALAMIRRAEPKAQTVTIARWQGHQQQCYDTVLLELREYFARLRSSRYGPMYFLSEHAYNCGWDGTSKLERPVQARQTEEQRQPLYIGRPHTPAAAQYSITA